MRVKKKGKRKETKNIVFLFSFFLSPLALSLSLSLRVVARRRTPARGNIFSKGAKYRSFENYRLRIQLNRHSAREVLRTLVGIRNNNNSSSSSSSSAVVRCVYRSAIDSVSRSVIPKQVTSSAGSGPLIDRLSCNTCATSRGDLTAPRIPDRLVKKLQPSLFLGCVRPAAVGEKKILFRIVACIGADHYIIMAIFSDLEVAGVK